MADVRLCKDCRWFTVAIAGSEIPWCCHPDQPSVDLVFGRPSLCIYARRDPMVARSASAPDFRGCGPEGRLFEARADV